MSSFHIIPWYFLLLGVEMPAGRSLLSKLLFFSFFSALDRQTGSYIINPVGDGGFSSNGRYDRAEMRRHADNNDDNAKNERSCPKLV